MSPAVFNRFGSPRRGGVSLESKAPYLGDAPSAYFEQILRISDLDSLLEILNRRVRHRYTAVYRMSEDQMQSLALYDADGSVPAAGLASVDRGHSFCQYVMRDGEFRTENSALDQRLDGHYAQGKMATYHGVALYTADGIAFGSLCHFDPKIRFLSEKEFAILQIAGTAISEFLCSSLVPADA